MKPHMKELREQLIVERLRNVCMFKAVRKMYKVDIRKLDAGKTGKFSLE